MSSILATRAAPPAAALLRRRQDELRSLLRAAAGAAIAGEHGEVLDLKDVAAAQTQAAVDEATRVQAVEALAQVAAALRRVEDGSYGLCEDCGEAIDPRRLLALPATPFCTACQQIHERAGVPRR